MRRGAAALLALVAIGATPSPSPSPRPTPNPYRQLDFASPTLSAQPQGRIAVTGGWAAVKRDGKGAVVCLSFKNEASVAATRVAFEFSITDRSGANVADLELDRKGTFSPGVAIEGWQSLSDWQGGVGHRGYGENCKTYSSGVAAFPLLSARYVTYHVRAVEYADGHSWPASSPQP